LTIGTPDDFNLPSYLEEASYTELQTPRDSCNMNKEQGDDLAIIEKVKKRKKVKSKAKKM
jgi:uncharacterized protein YgiM (DUF1202 family)